MTTQVIQETFLTKFSDRLRNVILNHNFVYEDVANKLGVSCYEFQSMIANNHFDLRCYRELVKMFPELRYAEKPANIRHVTPAHSKVEKESSEQIVESEQEDTIINHVENMTLSSTNDSDFQEDVSYENVSYEDFPHITFASAVCVCLNKYDMTITALARRLNFSYPGIYRILKTNKTSKKTYQKLVRLFPELREANLPDGRDFANKKKNKAGQLVDKPLRIHRPVNARHKKVAHNDNHDIAPNDAQFVASSEAQLESFRFANLLIKIKNSDTSNDVSAALKYMIENNHSIQELYNFINK